MKINCINNHSPNFSGRVVLKAGLGVSEFLRDTIKTNTVLSRVASDLGDKDLVVTVKTQSNSYRDMCFKGVDEFSYRLFLSSTKNPKSFGGKLWDFFTKVSLTKNYHSEGTTRSVLHNDELLNSFCDFHFNK